MQRSSIRATAPALAALVCVLAAPGFAAEPAYDVLITHARIVDGGGNPWYRGSIGVRDGRIVAIGAIDAAHAAKRTINAQDKVVAPGFIDLMGQETLVYLRDPEAALGRLYQGITTHVSGEGWSHAPQSAVTQPKPETIDGKPVRWRTFAEYFRILETHGVPINVAHNVGAMQVRSVVVGVDDREPTPDQLREMRDLVARAMCDGAFGLSSALIYPPGVYAKTPELAALAKVASAHGGFYSTHMRNESNGVLGAIDEAIQVGRQADIPVHIYHLKAAGRDNWPLITQAIARIDGARQSGLDVTADIYPYIRNGITLASFLPPAVYGHGMDAARAALAKPDYRRKLRAEVENASGDWENWYQHVGRDWSKVLIVDAGTYPRDVAGLSVAQVAQREKRDVWETFFDLVIGGVKTAPESMDEAQKQAALRAPWVMIETDTSPVSVASATSTHPRAFGSFPRVLAKYVREEHVITLEEAIRRMTSLVANRMDLPDRGRIAPGMAADLVIFDPARIQDHATFEQPLQFATGVDYLLINGRLSIDAGRATGALAGKVLRHAGGEATCHRYRHGSGTR